MLRWAIACFVLVSLSVVIHTFGLVQLGDWLVRHPLKTDTRVRNQRHAHLLTLVFAGITLLHLFETLIWAAFYSWFGLFGDFETSWYFSLGSYTTIGYGDVVLPSKWRMLGGVEGITGVLLCGLSTSFLFLVVNRMYQMRIQIVKQSERDGTDEVR